MTAMLVHLRRAAARAATAASVHTTTTAVRSTRCTASLLRVDSTAVSIRSFQTSTALLKQHTTDVTKGAKRSVAAALANKRDEDTSSDDEGEDEDDDAESDDEDDADSDDDNEDAASDDEDDDDDSDHEAAEVDAENPASAYIGVAYYPSKVKKYSAELHIDGHVISGGDYWTALDAAKGYDELVDLYYGLDTARNFPSGSAAAAEDAAAGLADAATATEWEVPEVGKRHADIIPPIPQTYLTIDEVLAALEKEKALDVYTIDLAGKSSLAEHMVFTTGRSQAHMRRMADMLIASMRARALDDEFEYAVEGRECDDWMIADCNSVVVHFMRADTRRILNLEDHWENMVDDKHRVYGDMTEDEYMDKFGTSELMEYLDDDDRESGESGDSEGSGVEWK